MLSATDKSIRDNGVCVTHMRAGAKQKDIGFPLDSWLKKDGIHE